jgi:predicted O-linked N-acetylglucosamine transferase (SPINDLY family)
MKLMHPARPGLLSMPRPAGDRVRIGYLSADFRDHPVSHLLAATIEAHDRRRFEIIGLSSHFVSDADPMTRRLQRGFDHFELLSALTDEEAAHRIQALGIDVLVDLNGLTAGERPGILSRRPAPIQVNFLGFPGTTGAPYLDYIVADRDVIPEGSDQYFSEQVVRLPTSFLPPGDDRPSPISPGRASLDLPEDALVLAAFHSGFKVSPELFAVWAECLRLQPRAVLWMSVSSERAKSRIRTAASDAAIDPDRIRFAARIPSRREHLHRLIEADLLLDTWTYNSHSSALDALWSGVPILTLRGKSFASRVCASLMERIGCADLVTADQSAYRALALELVSQPQRLMALRSLVSSGVENSGLFNVARHTSYLEAALGRMVDIHRRGDAPKGFDIGR